MMKLRRILQIGLPVVILAAGVLGAKALASLRKPPEVAAPEAMVPLVRTLTATERPVTLAVHARGTVTPRTESRLVSEVAGRVLRVSPALASGGFFEAQDELLALDPTDYVLALEQARARLATARSALVREQADAELARREWESLGSQREPTPLVLHEPQLEQARAEEAAARAALDKAERDVERCTIRAPYPGRVRARSVDVAQYVERGTELARVYAVDWAEVRLPVSDEDLPRLALPMDPAAWGGGASDGSRPEPAGLPRVVLSAHFAGAEREWQGEIVRAEGEVDPHSRMVVLVARVEDPYGRHVERRGGGEAPLLAGLFVDASIEGRALPAAVMLPRAALHPGPRVFVLGPDERLQLRPVQVLQSDREDVVLGGGLEAGERVVVSPLELPVEGMRLKSEGSLDAGLGDPAGDGR